MKKTRRIPRGAPKPPASQPPHEVKIALKAATVKALLELDAVVKQTQMQYELASQRMRDRLASILTEQGIAEAEVVSVDDQPPYTLTLLVKTFATPEG